MPSRRVFINVALFGIGAAVLLSQEPVQDYLLSRSPHERLMRHFAQFERKVARDPDIGRALAAVPDGDGRSLKLRELSRLGTPRLDDGALLERARLMSTLFAQMSDRACADVERGVSSGTENDAAEVETALLRLGPDFVARWMGCLHKAMLAEARQNPIPMVTRPQLLAAFGPLERKIGREAAMRVDAGWNERSPNEDIAWVARTVYAAAPTLPAPHGAVLLRWMLGSYQAPESATPPAHP